MAITTYSELKTAVADWLNRSDLTSAIPNFISLAEAQMSRQIRHRKMVTRATATMDTPYFAVPADWKETIRFQLNTNPITPLLYVTPEQLLEDSMSYSSAGQPMFFTTIGQQFEVLPQPDSVLRHQGESRQRAASLCRASCSVSSFLAKQKRTTF